MNTGLFVNYYLSTREKIYKELKKYNDELVKKDSLFVRENLSLFANLNYGGKAIRGVLAHLGYYLLKDNPDYALGLSLAYEIFQTAILIHDDIIDNDNQRRGKDTVPYANYKKYKKYSKDDNELKDLGNSFGICVGDYGLYQANKIIIDNYGNDSNFNKVISYFHNTVINTIIFVLPVIFSIISDNVVPKTGTANKNRNNPTNIEIITIAFILLLMMFLGSTLYISFDVFIIEYVPLLASKNAEK